MLRTFGVDYSSLHQFLNFRKNFSKWSENKILKEIYRLIMPRKINQLSLKRS